VDNQSLLAEVTTVDDQTHSKHLLRMIAFVTQNAGLRISEIEGFAVCQGPGSFTGLRIGMSTVKGLAAALRKPMVGISSLDALAEQTSPDADLICPWLDARKGEIYFARYRAQKGQLHKISPEQVMAPDKALADIEEPCVFSGNGAQIYRDAIESALGERANFSSSANNTIRAFTIARLSLERFENFCHEDIAGLVPNYIRRSEAELNFSQKASKRKSGNG
jgi:tRNA threonylcarbamoyladenosine biosynthesis protein TsaB